MFLGQISNTSNDGFKILLDNIKGIADGHDGRCIRHILRRRTPVAPFTQTILARGAQLLDHTQYGIPNDLCLFLQKIEINVIHLAF